MFDPDGITNLVNAIAPALIGGLVAVSGTITLFWLQQAAERRAREARRIEEAFEKFTSFCAYVAQQVNLSEGQPLKFNRWDVYDRGWRFTWTLPKRDRAIGTWAMAVVVGSIEAVADSSRDPAKLREMEENMNLAITFLDRWKQGNLKRNWFEQQLKKHGFRDQEPPSLKARASVAD